MRVAAHDSASQGEEKPLQIDAGGVGAEFRSLVSGCGLYPLDRAWIVLAGSDRVRWLNGMVTNNIRDLKPGQGVYAFLLNPQGRIQGDLYAFNRGDSLIVDTEGRQADAVLQVFDRYIIMDDVELDNQRGKFAAIGIAGSKSGEVLAAAGLDGQQLQPLQFAEVSWNGLELTLVRGDNPSVPNYVLRVPSQNANPTRYALLQAGAQEVNNEALEALRIACGIPEFGRDIRDRDLPQETAQDRALNFSKGCYVGQEIVERIRSRGAVHRTFVGFEIEGSELPPGAKVQHAAKDVGEITSVATVPTNTGSRSLALGYLRKEFMVGKELNAGESSVRAVSLPFRGIFSD